MVRARSLALPGATSTIRLEKVLPSRTMSAVEKLFMIDFSANVALTSVEPASASGPVWATTAARTSAHRGEPGISRSITAVYAPRSAAAARAPATYGVRPLAVSPMTRSRPVTSPASSAPWSRSSSAPSTARNIAVSPPARCATTRSGAG